MQWSPNKNWTLELRGAAWLVNTPMCEKGEASWFPGRSKLCVRDSPKPQPMYLVIWLLPICILYNKTVIIKLSWVPWVILENCQNWGECGNLLDSQLAGQSVGDLGTPNVCLATEVRAVFWRTEFPPGGVCTNSRRLVPEWDCSTSGAVRPV